jgi:membrane protein implicated in regulation of membrane protease activity
MDVPTFGMPAQAIAILMIVFGLLILVIPPLLPWLVGILLVVLGVMMLVGAQGWVRGRTREPHYPPRV